MTNAEQIALIAKWQGAGFVHPLTCGTDSGHENLEGREIDGAVMLVCPTCGYRQAHVPGVVLSDYVDELRSSMDFFKGEAR
jgi:hypothetical protein